MLTVASVQSSLLRSLTVLAMLLTGTTTPVLAALGEDLSSVESDRASLHASARVLPGQFYNVHEIRASSGTIVREFVSPAGAVFGVAWQGFSPDLRQLLGTHYDELLAFAQTHTVGRGFRVDTGDFVFETGGHMRFVVGRAFLRAKIPQGVSSDEIR